MIPTLPVSANSYQTQNTSGITSPTPSNLLNSINTTSQDILNNPLRADQLRPSELISPVRTITRNYLKAKHKMPIKKRIEFLSREIQTIKSQIENSKRRTMDLLGASRVIMNVSSDPIQRNLTIRELEGLFKKAQHCIKTLTPRLHYFEEKLKTLKISQDWLQSFSFLKISLPEETEGKENQ